MNEEKDLIEELNAAKDHLSALRQAKAGEFYPSIEEQELYIESIREELGFLEAGQSEELAEKADVEAMAVGSGDGLAVVVGHCLFKEGACGIAPIENCEAAYNTPIAERIVSICESKGIRSKVFSRAWGDKCLINTTYKKRVMPWKPRCTVELHYNGGNVDDPYTVTLFARNDSRSWALQLQKEISACCLCIVKCPLGQRIY